MVAVYLLNRAPIRSLNGKTPYEAWHGRKPGARHLRTLGCMAYAKKLGPGVSKLFDRSVPGVFLSYEPGTRAYRVYDRVNKKLIISRDVIFDEMKGWNWGEKKIGAVVADDDIEPSFSVFYPKDEHGTVAGSTIGDAAENAGNSGDQIEPASPIQSIPSQVGQGEASPHTPLHSISGSNGGNQIQWATPPSGGLAGSEGAPLRYRIISDLLEQTREVQMEYSGVCLAAAEEPSSVNQALEELCWRDAMKAEMQAIEANKTWEVGDLPRNHKAIGLKWVFKVNKDPDGNIVKHKARLVVKGYAQIQGVDFNEVFAPVARIETVRVLLALC